MQGNGFSANRRIPVYAVLALLALAAAALVFLSAPPVSAQEGDPITKTAAFGSGVTIPDKTYTAGARVNQVFTSAADQGLPRLPEVDVTFNADIGKGYYEVDYTATGLPDGLSMAYDRVIRGIPAEATSAAATVTYTATVTFYTADESSETSPGSGIFTTFDNAGTASASLTFRVSVNPAVSWSAEAQKFFDSRIIAYVPEKGWTTTTFPEARDGTGTLTYRLIHNASRTPLADHVDSITFNASTRTIGGTLTAGERYAVTFIARDVNGSVAQGYTEVRHGIGGL